MSASFLPRGTGFNRSADAGVTNVKIAEAKTIEFSVKGEFEDVSNMDTPTPYKEWLPTMIDGGSVKLDLNFINADPVQSGLFADIAAQTNLTWTAQLPNARGKFVMNGYVEELSPKFEVNKAATFTASIKITGALTWTPSV
jgi:hypothetical protein